MQVTVLLAGLFTLEEMVLSPDLFDELTAHLDARCTDLGAVDKVRCSALLFALCYALM
jgi:hypothetical protein